ncbi:hypothetical protein OF83DRAFT_1089696 [Amylostereum chailletii]|nr:hypothetical protein OF83DRAFT_1089696 [Amylostereum chailletii]
MEADQVAECLISALQFPLRRADNMSGHEEGVVDEASRFISIIPTVLKMLCKVEHLIAQDKSQSTGNGHNNQLGVTTRSRYPISHCLIRKDVAKQRIMTVPQLVAVLTTQPRLGPSRVPVDT